LLALRHPPLRLGLQVTVALVEHLPNGRQILRIQWCAPQQSTDVGTCALALS
jgi:hypothetical protein